MNRLKKYLDKFDHPRILDIGSGKGDFIHLLDSVYPDYQEIIGIDIVDYLLEMDDLAFQNNPKIKWMDKDVLEATFPKHSFDVISLSNTLHHIDDKSSLFNKMINLLKPGGILIVSEMFTSNKLTNKQVSHQILHSFSAKIISEMNMVHSQISNVDCVIEAIEKYSPLPITEYWELNTQPYEVELTYEYLAELVDKLLVAVKDSSKFDLYNKEADEIKNYLKLHGLSLQNQICVVIKINN